MQQHVATGPAGDYEHEHDQTLRGPCTSPTTTVCAVLVQEEFSLCHHTRELGAYPKSITKCEMPDTRCQIHHDDRRPPCINHHAPANSETFSRNDSLPHTNTCLSGMLDPFESKRSNCGNHSMGSQYSNIVGPLATADDRICSQGAMERLDFQPIMLWCGSPCP
jgi:hypothetical protein